MIEWWTENWEFVLWWTGSLAFALCLALAIHFLVFRLIRRFTQDSNKKLTESIIRHAKSSSLLLLVSTAILLVLRMAPLQNVPERLIDGLRQLVSLVLIGGFGWLLVRLTNVVQDMLDAKYSLSLRDNLKARKIHTQLGMLKKIAAVIIIVITVCSMIMTFEKAKQLGTSILASAGIIGIIVGLAAQKSIGTMIAGLQIALTQPIRIDDVVIVEGEWGRIEEITLTYVVVKIWDLRRLVVPINYFIEKPFQNWTRVSADLLGSVFLYVDYGVPLDELRNYLHNILKANDKWDKKVWVLQVTNCTDKSMELRALMSAEDAPTAWDLRCEIREQLINFIREKSPQSLPRMRAEIADKEGERQLPGTEPFDDQGR